MSRHARVDQRIMRRSPLFGWRLVRLDGTAVYSDLKKDVEHPLHHSPHGARLYAPPVLVRRWIPGEVDPAELPPRARPAMPPYREIFILDPDREPGDWSPFDDDGRLDLARLKNEGWHVTGAIKDDEIVTALRHDVDITSLKEDR